MQYDYYIVQTYNFSGGGSSSNIRVRPIPGQNLTSSINVECSKNMRKKYPVGTLFKLRAKLTDRENGTPFLYSHYSSSYEVISKDRADKYIKEHYKN